MLDDGEEEPIRLYFCPTANGLKISILLEELGVPYDLEFADIGKSEPLAPETSAGAPDRRVPAIVDPEGPDGHPLAIFGSDAILHYLSRKYDAFYPLTERARADVDQWLFWQASGLGPTAAQCMYFRVDAPEKIPQAIEYYTREVARHFAAMDGRLSDRPYLAGVYSIADIASFPWVRAWKILGQDITKFPNLERWLGEIGKRPAVLRGLAVMNEETAGS